MGMCIPEILTFGLQPKRLEVFDGFNVCEYEYGIEIKPQILQLHKYLIKDEFEIYESLKKNLNPYVWFEAQKHMLISSLSFLIFYFQTLFLVIILAYNLTIDF